ncbi:hypothetical protein HZR84_01915 [Hyphobacterium sp. CCMP332]|nr:hypothetical protein HZR84_01915 [Hyphobacterium sp. CCMP332]
MSLILTILILISGNNNYTDNISEFNKVKREAEFAYNDENYHLAVEKYSYLIDSLNYQNDAAKLNLAHSLYQMDEIDKAKTIYSDISNSKDKEIKSIANQQLGVFESRGKNLQKSLDFFKKSLMANPSNEDARYNYELVKKKLEEEQNQENQDQDKKQDQDQNQDQKDQDQNQDQKDQKNQQQNKEQEQKEQEQKSEEDKKKEEQENKEEQKEQGQKDKEDEQKPEPKEGEEQNPEEMKNQAQPGEPNFEEKEISKEMAEMILQAMRNKELQYLQQIKRKPQKPVNKDKPDW